MFLSLVWLGCSFQLVAIPPNRGPRGCHRIHMFSLRRIKIWDLYGRYRNPPLHTKNQVRHHKQKNHTKGSYWSCITIAIFPYYTQLPLCAYVVPYSLQNASLGSSLSFQRAFWPSSGVRHPCPNRRHCDRQWKRQSSWNASSLCEAEFDPHRPQHDQMNQKVFILRKVLPFPLLSLPVDCFNGFQKLAAFLHESEDESPFWYLTNEVRCTQLGNPRSSPNNQFPSYKGPKHEITKKKWNISVI